MTTSQTKKNESIRPLKVALIGGGINSAVGRVHEIAIRMDGKFELVAGCFSRHADINRETGHAYGLIPERVYTTSQALLAAERDQLDAVVIATPTQTHAELIHQVLDQGLTVITDKPTVATPAEGQALLERLGPDTRRLFTIFNYTGYPVVREMKSLIGQGAIGEVFKLMIEMPQDGFLRMKNNRAEDAVQPWRKTDGEICGLSLDLFTHIHSLALFLTGAHPVDAWAKMRSISKLSPGLIDEVDTIVEYNTGMILNAWYGKVALGYRNGLRLRAFGTQGSLEWEQMNPETLVFTDAQGDTHIRDRISTNTSILNAPRYNRFKGGHPAGFIEAFANYYSDIFECITTSHRNSLLLPLNASIEGISLCQTIQRASVRRESKC